MRAYLYPPRTSYRDGFLVPRILLKILCVLPTLNKEKQNKYSVSETRLWSLILGLEANSVISTTCMLHYACVPIMNHLHSWVKFPDWKGSSAHSMKSNDSKRSLSPSMCWVPWDTHTTKHGPQLKRFTTFNRASGADMP